MSQTTDLHLDSLHSTHEFTQLETADPKDLSHTYKCVDVSLIDEDSEFVHVKNDIGQIFKLYKKDFIRINKNRLTND